MLLSLLLLLLLCGGTKAFAPQQPLLSRMVAEAPQSRLAIGSGALHRNGHEVNRHEAPILNVPRHVAFICDGNSRWAEARGLPASAGHAAGADRLLRCLETLKEVGVECCTMYGFSTENWKRSPKEIQDILGVIEETGRRFHTKAVEENVRVKILGDLDDDRIPSSLRTTLRRLEEDTFKEEERQLTVCLAINYGGRQDIKQAALQIAKAVASGEIHVDTMTEEHFSTYLYTSGVPDPDLIVRTGGDQRLSNFLLWNTAYAELFFTDSLWPDFDEKCLKEALRWFSTRSRRFGGRMKDVAQTQREEVAP